MQEKTDCIHPVYNITVLSIFLYSINFIHRKCLYNQTQTVYMLVTKQ